MIAGDSARRVVEWTLAPAGDPPRRFSIFLLDDRGFMPLGDLAALMAIDAEELRALAKLQPSLGQGDFVELHPAEEQLAKLFGISPSGRTGLLLNNERREHRYVVCFWLLHLATSLQALQATLQTLLTLGRAKGRAP